MIIKLSDVLIVTEKEEIFSDALIYSGDKRVASVAAFDLWRICLHACL